MNRKAGIAVLSLALVGCESPRKETRSEPRAAEASSMPAVVKPWTDRFQTTTLLIADELRIEGPDGLLDHLATRADMEVHTKVERVTAQGFLQEVALKPGVPPIEIRAFLDRFELVAMKKLTVLERPGPVDVVLVATGDVFCRDATTQAVQRVPVLRVEGKILR